MSSFRQFRANLKKSEVTRDQGQESSDPNVIHPRLLQSARQSGRLDLANRGLTLIPDSVYSLLDLSQRDTSKGSSLNGDGERWWETVDLTQLLLAHNSITQIDGRILNFDTLTVLDLSHNRLDSLPSEVGQLQQLRVVNLTGNQFTTVPDALFALPLQDLKLTDNRLTTIPEDRLLTWATSLIRLDLTRNQLTELPRDFGTLTTLLDLRLAKNRLEYLPPNWWQCPKLENLDVSANKLRCLFLLPAGHDRADPPVRISFPRLKVIDAHGNALVGLFGQCVPTPVTVASQPLDIGHLQLDFPALVEFSVAYNRLADLSPVTAHCPQLLTLDANSNRLTDLPVGLFRLRNISRLDISMNNFRALPLRLGLLESLKVLLFAGNPLRLGSRGTNTESVLTLLRNRLSAEEAAGQLPDEPAVTEVVNVAWAGATESTPAATVPEHNEAATLAAVPAATAAESAPVAISQPPTEPSPGEDKLVSAPAATKSLTHMALPSLVDYVQPTVVPDDAAEPVTSSPVVPDDQQARLLALKLESLNLESLRVSDLVAVTYAPRQIDLSNNRLTALPVCLVTSYYQTLTSLDLSKNRLDQIPWWTASSALPALSALRQLSLSHNAIKAWPSLLPAAGGDTLPESLPVEALPYPNLDELNLSDCHLLETPAYSLRLLFPKLTVLLLRHCHIERIPNPTAFDGIIRLDLSDNNIAHLPPKLALNSALQALFVEGNSFRFPRYQIVQQGTHAILEYLRGRIPR
ncbi:hypothetical protein IWQ60_002789 [Tieghemiomyces parasiticus]|uniref:Leucine-rich repeat-containing protein 40 n=1 Tax=Tieghemiomyces parasiticus TaxID=78921 RepID=A0A9W8E1B6_9FUNG|nr:hypothetical protein IWQ60_002789 [Tieghemiomyces parasiticus]